MTLGLDPARCVLAIVDFQNDFCHEDGAISRLGQDTSGARAILPNVRRLIDLARSADVPRVYVQVVHSHWTDAQPWRRRSNPGGILDVSRVPIAELGSWGARLYELQPDPDELVLTKHRYSAFAHTPLRLVMQAKEATHLVLAGVQTNVCVHASARDAVQDGFVPTVVADCVAAGTDDEHRVALGDIRQRMGLVVTLDELEESWSLAGGNSAQDPLFAT